jgi:peptide/nickel transport system permease protein
MLRFVARRLFLSLLVLFGVSLLVYGIMRLAPGDPALAQLGIYARPEQLAELRRQLGLDKPIYVLYLRWLWQMLRGDFGVSIMTKEQVSTLLLQSFPITLQLTFMAMFFVVLIAFPTGIFSAMKRGAVGDQVSRVGALIGISMPEFWLALLFVMVFAVQLHWFPPGGYVRPSQGVWPWLRSLLLPCLALAAAPASALSRMVRASMLEVLGRDYVRTARGKGLPPARVLLHHALRNALVAPMTIMGMQIGYLLGGAIIVETIFYFPGMGRMLMSAAHYRDYSVIQGVVMIAAVAFVMSNLIVDVLYAVLNPQVRQEFGQAEQR